MACTSLRKDETNINSHPIEKENHLPNLRDFVFHVNLPGCPIFLYSSIQPSILFPIAGDIFNVGDPLPEVPGFPSGVVILGHFLIYTQ